MYVAHSVTAVDSRTVTPTIPLALAYDQDELSCVSVLSPEPRLKTNSVFVIQNLLVFLLHAFVARWRAVAALEEFGLSFGVTSGLPFGSTVLLISADHRSHSIQRRVDS